jgi:hypothetical protein
MSFESKADSFVASLIANENLSLSLSILQVFVPSDLLVHSEVGVEPTDFICHRNATGREKQPI